MDPLRWNASTPPRHARRRLRRREASHAPLYLSEILLYLGLLLLSVSLTAAAIWLAGIVFLHVVARREEQLLRSRFGWGYVTYVRDVGMWFPRPRKP